MLKRMDITPETRPTGYEPVLVQVRLNSTRDFLEGRVIKTSERRVHLILPQPLEAGELVRVRAGSHEQFAIVQSCNRWLEPCSDQFIVGVDIEQPRTVSPLVTTAFLAGLGSMVLILGIAAVITDVIPVWPRSALSPSADVSGSVLPASDDEAPDETPQEGSEVLIRTQGQSWVTACADDEMRLSRLFTVGNTATIRFRRRAVVRVGDANSVQLALGGRPVDLPGRPGQVRVVEFTAEGARFLSPGESGDCTEQVPLGTAQAKPDSNGEI